MLHLVLCRALRHPEAASLRTHQGSNSGFESPTKSSSVSTKSSLSYRSNKGKEEERVSVIKLLTQNSSLRLNSPTGRSSIGGINDHDSGSATSIGSSFSPSRNSVAITLGTNNSNPNSSPLGMILRTDSNTYTNTNTNIAINDTARVTSLLASSSPPRSMKNPSLFAKNNKSSNTFTNVTNGSVSNGSNISNIASKTKKHISTKGVILSKINPQEFSREDFDYQNDTINIGNANSNSNIKNNNNKTSHGRDKTNVIVVDNTSNNMTLGNVYSGHGYGNVDDNFSTVSSMDGRSVQSLSQLVRSPVKPVSAGIASMAMILDNRERPRATPPIDARGRIMDPSLLEGMEEVFHLPAKQPSSQIPPIFYQRDNLSIGNTSNMSVSISAAGGAVSSYNDDEGPNYDSSDDNVSYIGSFIDGHYSKNYELVDLDHDQDNISTHSNYSSMTSATNNTTSISASTMSKSRNVPVISSPIKQMNKKGLRTIKSSNFDDDDMQFVSYSGRNMNM